MAIKFIRRAKGDKFRPQITVLKSKMGIPTVIEVAGHRYILRNQEPKSGGKE